MSKNCHGKWRTSKSCTFYGLKLGASRDYVLKESYIVKEWHPNICILEDPPIHKCNENIYFIITSLMSMYPALDEKADEDYIKTFPWYIDYIH